MFFNKKQPVKKPLLLEEDIKELREIERKSYVEKARELAKQKGQNDAQRDYTVKQEATLW